MKIATNTPKQKSISSRLNAIKNRLKYKPGNSSET